jgi:DNA-binding transcriptional LysR family regulator
VRQPGIPGDHPPVEQPHDLCREACLLATTDRWTFTHADQPVEGQVSGPLRADDSEALFEAARCGLGIALLPTWLTADDLSNGRLLPVLADWEPRLPAGNGAIWGVYAPKKAVSRKVRVFIDFVEQHLRQRVIWSRQEAAAAG